jgi:hypothetical protein
MNPFSNTTAPITAASTKSPRKIDSAAAPSRTTTNG